MTKSCRIESGHRIYLASGNRHLAIATMGPKIANTNSKKKSQHCMSNFLFRFYARFFFSPPLSTFSLFSFSHSLKLQTSSQNHQNPSLRDLSFASFFFSVSGDSLMSRIYSSLSGGELFEKITSEGYSMSEAEVINYMRQICEGVKHMHERNIIHLGK